MVCNIHLQDTTCRLPDESQIEQAISIDFNKLELAIRDIKEEFPDKYDVGDTYLKQLARFKKQNQILLSGTFPEKLIDQIDISPCLELFVHQPEIVEFRNILQ